MGLNDKECGILTLIRTYPTLIDLICGLLCQMQHMKCLLWMTPPRLPCSACEQSCQCWYIGESCIQLLVKNGLGTVTGLHVESKTSNLATWEIKFKWRIGSVWHYSPHCKMSQTIHVCSIQLPACSKSRKSKALHFPGTLPSDGSGSSPPCIPSPQNGMFVPATYQTFWAFLGTCVTCSYFVHFHLGSCNTRNQCEQGGIDADNAAFSKCFTQAAPRVRESYDS